MRLVLTQYKPLMQRPMRPVRVVMTGVLAEYQPQVPLAGDQHPVQALTAGAGDPAFRRSRSPETPGPES